MIHTVGPLLWTCSLAVIFTLLAIDLTFLRKGDHIATLRESLIWTIGWVSCALLFNLFIYYYLGSEPAVEFLTGYLIEYSLSVDNLFVFMLIFSYFRVPGEFQQRVLFFGIIGAILMRALFIFAGAALIENFHWILYFFGALLVFSGVKLFKEEETEIHPEKNPVYKLFKRILPMVPNYNKDHFFVKHEGKWHSTPLFLVLISVEVTDLIFAVDSIPAIFAITKDAFIIFTSNIFAVLGLRSLFFLLSGTMSKMEYLRSGLALILCFVGAKMLLEDIYKVPNLLSLAIITTILAVSVVMSLRVRRKHAT